MSLVQDVRPYGTVTGGCCTGGVRGAEATWWVCGDHEHELQLVNTGTSWWLRLRDRDRTCWAQQFPDEASGREAAGEVMTGRCCPEHACADWWCLLNHGIIML